MVQLGTSWRTSLTVLETELQYAQLKPVPCLGGAVKEQVDFFFKGISHVWVLLTLTVRSVCGCVFVCG